METTGGMAAEFEFEMNHQDDLRRHQHKHHHRKTLISLDAPHVGMTVSKAHVDKSIPPSIFLCSIPAPSPFPVTVWLRSCLPSPTPTLCVFTCGYTWRHMPDLKIPLTSHLFSVFLVRHGNIVGGYTMTATTKMSVRLCVRVCPCLWLQCCVCNCLA